MINLTGALIEQYTIALMLTSVRFMGLLLTAPMLSFRAFPISFRVMLNQNHIQRNQKFQNIMLIILKVIIAQ